MNNHELHKAAQALEDSLSPYQLARRLLEAEERYNHIKHDINYLISNSDGVAGLHLNGDVAPWTDLLEGGRHEEWLLSLSNSEAIT